VNPWNSLISDFGSRLGMYGLGPNSNGVVALAISSIGDLILEPAGEGCLACLSRNLPFVSDKVLKTALTLCHTEEQWPFPVHAGLRGENRLSFVIQLPPSLMTLPDLERALDQLKTMQDRLASATA